MQYPTIETAEKELALAARLNPGPWISHSKNVSEACKIIASKSGLDADKARILGLLHDIGRRVGVCQERHMVEGYRYCAERGWLTQARICVTHAFMIRDIRATLGSWDVEPEGYALVKELLDTSEYDDYDRLVQLCDSLALAEGFCLLEKRFVDVSLRYGVNEYVVPRWKAIFSLKEYFEDKMGARIYDALPGVRETTFAERSR